MKARGLFLLLLAGCASHSDKTTTTDSTAATTTPALLNYSVGAFTDTIRHPTRKGCSSMIINYLRVAAQNPKMRSTGAWRVSPI